MAIIRRPLARLPHLLLALGAPRWTTRLRTKWILPERPLATARRRRRGLGAPLAPVTRCFLGLARFALSRVTLLDLVGRELEYRRGLRVRLPPALARRLARGGRGAEPAGVELAHYRRDARL